MHDFGTDQARVMRNEDTHTENVGWGEPLVLIDMHHNQGLRLLQGPAKALHPAKEIN